MVLDWSDQTDVKNVSFQPSSARHPRCTKMVVVALSSAELQHYCSSICFTEKRTNNLIAPLIPAFQFFNICHLRQCTSAGDLITSHGGIDRSQHCLAFEFQYSFSVHRLRKSHFICVSVCSCVEMHLAAVSAAAAAWSVVRCGVCFVE